MSHPDANRRWSSSKIAVVSLGAVVVAMLIAYLIWFVFFRFVPVGGLG